MLHLDPLYGGHLFASLFSFVSAGGNCAGRLTEFDTGDSDWVYALSVYPPFLLTLPGFQLMNLSGNAGRRLLFGLAIPFAFAPVISLTGDCLELGSLALFQVWQGPDAIYPSMISDYLFHLIEEVGSKTTVLSLGQPTVVIFIFSSFLLGIALAWITLFGSDALTADWGWRPN